MPRPRCKLGAGAVLGGREARKVGEEAGKRGEQQEGEEEVEGGGIEGAHRVHRVQPAHLVAGGVLGGVQGGGWEGGEGGMLFPKPSPSLWLRGLQPKRCSLYASPSQTKIPSSNHRPRHAIFRGFSL